MSDSREGGISIRRSLLQDLVIVILLLGGGLFLTTVFGTREAVETLSETVIHQSADEIELALRRFFDPVERGVAVARSWGVDGLLDIENPEALNLLFRPVLEQTPQIASILVADSSGGQYQLIRDADSGQYWNRLFREEWGDRAQKVEWAGGEAVSTWVDKEYDPRERPWFRGALALVDAGNDTGNGNGDRIHWTEAYTFITNREPGLTASVAFADDGGGRVVVGFDVRLEEITAFTSQEHATRNGLVAVLDSSGRLLGLPALPRFTDRNSWREALLRTPDELEIALIDDANAAFQSHGTGGGLTPVSFRSGGTLWWAQGRAIALSDQAQLLIAILVPDSDVFEQRRALRMWILGLTGLVLVIAAVRAFSAADRFSVPMEALAEESERISRGDLEAGERVESQLKEVRQLASAHEHMRLGLISLMKMERDIQMARQIQQSTFPDKLPSIPGFEIAAWNEPADETGGDTYDVISFDVDGDEVVDRALLLLADATGHGIGPALVATQSRAMLRMAVRLDEGLPGIVKNLNEQLFADLPGNRFLTAWFGILDAGAGTLTSFSAGQAPLVYYRASEGRAETSGAHTLPLGMMPDIPVDVPEPLAMAPGDIFAVLSDGIFEAVGEDDEPFGEERVKALLERHKDAPVSEILEAIQQAVEVFTDGRPADDDRTVWLVKRAEVMRTARR